jgi:hypothetical protein
MTVTKSTQIICQILDALAYAHSAAVTVRAASGEKLSLHGVVASRYEAGQYFNTG